MSEFIWDETKTDMSVVGADLQLDEGFAVGTYETGSQDKSEIAWYYISAECKVEASPAATGTMSWTIEIDTSLNDIAWDGYQLFQEGEFYCRYYRFKITVYGEPSTAQRPKITRFEDDPRRVDEVPCPAPITAVQNQPAGTETRGDRFRVGTGAGDWAGHDKELVECMDATTPSWRYTHERKGMRAWNDATSRVDLLDELGEWVNYDARRLHSGHVHMNGWSYSVVNAGTWTPTVDAAQVMTNGFFDNYAGALQADGDEVDFQCTLAVGTYTILYFTKESVGHAIIDIDIDNGGGAVEVASFDCYAAGPANNIRKSDAGNAVTVAGLYTVTVRVDGRNVNNVTDWKADIGYIVFFRTA